LLDFLIDNRATNYEAGWMAELVEKLVWTINDQRVAEIFSELERWATEGDKYRCCIVLSIKEFVIKDTTLEKIHIRFPELKEHAPEVFT
jgi:hypothetical protein